MDLLYKELANLSSNSIQWSMIKENLENVTRGERRLLGRASGDFFYIPREFFPETLPMLQLLGKYHIFLEIGVVTALRPASANFHVVDLKAHDWGQGTVRGKPFEHVYSTSFEMLHPFKMGKVKTYFNGSDSNEFASSCVFCNLVKISLYFNFLRNC